MFDLTAQLNIQAPAAAQLARVAKDIEKKFSGVKINLDTKNFSKASNEVNNLGKDLDKASGKAKNFAEMITMRGASFAAFSVASSAIIRLTGAFTNATREALKFDVEMAKIAQTTGRSVSEIRAGGEEILNISRKYGVASNKVAELTRLITQTGRSFKEAAKAADILARTNLLASFDNLQDTTEGLIALMNSFQLSMEESGRGLEVINVLAKRFAVESGDIVSAIKRAGGAFSAAGGTMEELAALFTAVRSTSRESAETIGTAFRTIFGRLQRPKTIEYFKQLNIELADAEGNFIGPKNAIFAIADGLDKLGIKAGSIKFAEVAEQIGGIRQLSKVIPLLTQTAKARRALAIANTAEAESDRDVQKAKQTLSQQLAELTANFRSLIAEIMGSAAFQTLASGFIGIANAAIEIGRALKPLLPLLTFMATIKLGKGLLDMFKFASSGGAVKAVSSAVGMARGGIVPGQGSGDTVPAMLTPGEFVIRKSAVQAFGAKNLGKINKYASGGVVEASRHSAEIQDRILNLPRGFTVGKAFNRGDKFLANIKEERIEVAEGHAAQTNADAFEEYALSQVSAKQTKANDYLDGIGPGGQLYEAKSGAWKKTGILGKLASHYLSRGERRVPDKTTSGDDNIELGDVTVLTKMNRGGAISGTDTVPAMLTPGEFVVNQKSAKAYGYGNLRRINKYAKGGMVQKFAEGGDVGFNIPAGGTGLFDAPAQKFMKTLIEAGASNEKAAAAALVFSQKLESGATTVEALKAGALEAGFGLKDMRAETDLMAAIANDFSQNVQDASEAVGDKFTPELETLAERTRDTGKVFIDQLEKTIKADKTATPEKRMQAAGEGMDPLAFLNKSTKQLEADQKKLSQTIALEKKLTGEVNEELRQQAKAIKEEIKTRKSVSEASDRLASKGLKGTLDAIIKMGNGSTKVGGMMSMAGAAIEKMPLAAIGVVGALGALQGGLKAMGIELANSPLMDASQMRAGLIGTAAAGMAKASEEGGMFESIGQTGADVGAYMDRKGGGGALSKGVGKLGKGVSKAMSGLVKFGPKIAKAANIVGILDAGMGALAAAVTTNHEALKKQAVESGNVAVAGESAQKAYNQKVLSSIPILGNFFNILDEFTGGFFGQLMGNLMSAVGDTTGAMVKAEAELAAATNRAAKDIARSAKAMDLAFQKGAKNMDFSELGAEMRGETATGAEVNANFDQLSKTMADNQKLMGKSMRAGTGATGGALTGAAGGAVMGAAVGTVIPIIGTAIGAGVGALIGGVVGAFRGANANFKQMEKNAKAARDASARYTEQEVNRLKMLAKASNQVANATFAAGGSMKDFTENMKKAMGGELTGVLKVLDTKGIDAAEKALSDRQANIIKSRESINAAYANANQRERVQLDLEKDMLDDKQKVLDEETKLIQGAKTAKIVQEENRRQMDLTNAAYRERIKNEKALYKEMARANQQIKDLDLAEAMVEFAETGRMTGELLNKSFGETNITTKTFEESARAGGLGEAARMATGVIGQQAGRQISQAAEFRAAGERAISGGGLAQMFAADEITGDAKEREATIREKLAQEMFGGNVPANFQKQFDKMVADLVKAGPTGVNLEAFKKSMEAAGEGGKKAYEMLQKKLKARAEGLAKLTDMRKQLNDMELAEAQARMDATRKFAATMRGLEDDLISTLESAGMDPKEIKKMRATALKNQKQSILKTQGAGSIGEFLTKTAGTRAAATAATKARQKTEEDIAKKTPATATGVTTAAKNMADRDRAEKQLIQNLKEENKTIGELVDVKKKEIQAIAASAKAEQDRQNALNTQVGNLAMEFAGATDEGRAQIAKEMLAAREVARTGSLVGIDENMRGAALSRIGQYAGMGPLEMFGGRTAESIMADASIDQLRRSGAQVSPEDEERIRRGIEKKSVPLPEQARQAIEEGFKEIEALEKAKLENEKVIIAQQFSNTDRFRDAVNDFEVAVAKMFGTVPTGDTDVGGMVRNQQEVDSIRQRQAAEKKEAEQKRKEADAMWGQAQQNTPVSRHAAAGGVRRMGQMARGAASVGRQMVQQAQQRPQTRGERMARNSLAAAERMRKRYEDRGEAVPERIKKKEEEAKRRLGNLDVSVAPVKVQINVPEIQNVVADYMQGHVVGLVAKAFNDYASELQGTDGSPNSIADAAKKASPATPQPEPEQTQQTA